MRVKDNLSASCKNTVVAGISEYIVEIDMTSFPITEDQIKMEPMSPPVVQTSRKRNASQLSWNSSGRTSSSSTSSGTEKPRKKKKYELDPSSDPSVKNAVAAKANRDKKKQEELKRIADCEMLRARNLELQQRLQEAFKVEADLRRQIEEERTKTQRAQEDSGTFFKDIQTDLNSKNSTNDDLEDIEPTFNISNFNDYIGDDFRFFSSPGSPEKAEKEVATLSPSNESLCQPFVSDLSELSSCLDPVLTLPIRPEEPYNAAQRNLMGEFNNIMNYLE